MAVLEFVQIPTNPLERFAPIVGPEGFARIERIADRARREFAGRAIWHVSSTARGGGVAEILHMLLPYVRAAGVDTRWVVLRESDEFFAVTKRLHNRLHGDRGDGGELGEDERRVYELALEESAIQLEQFMQPGDVVYLHDPQTAGLVDAMREMGTRVIWRCHIGVDEPNELVRSAWDFLTGYVDSSDAFVFSRADYVWDGIDRGRVWLMPPAIDPFSPKNQELDPKTAESILRVVGLRSGAPEQAPVFTRGDGTPDRVERPAELLQEEALPDGARLVLQVSRWDRLKDPRGLLECFLRHLPDPDIHLVLAAPATGAVADDPEGDVVYGDVSESWRRMPDEARRRAHLVSLPMDDLDENGVMVNALQRRADVIVQKSVAEGFGLTVSEAMWKERVVVGSRLGGIQDQIVDGESGILIDDPADLQAFGDAIHSVLVHPKLAATLGKQARERVIDRFLAAGRLTEYVEVIATLMSR
jgi:trehalose synthase